MLSHITGLQRRIVGELVLNAEIPLLHSSGFVVGIPKAEFRAFERITSRRHDQALVGGGGRQRPVGGDGVSGAEVGLPHRRIHWKAKIGARAFQIGRQGIRAAEYGLASHGLGRPREPDARLKVVTGVVGVIQRAAIAERAALAGDIDRAGEQSEVGLPVFHFHPGGVVFIAHAEVEGQASGNVVVVLQESRDYVRTLAPSAGLGAAAAVTAGQTQEEVGLSSARILAAVADGTLVAVVAGIVHVDALAEELKTGVDVVLTFGDDHGIVELDHGAGEKLLAAGDGTPETRGKVVVAEGKTQQAGAYIVGIGDSYSRT